MRKRFLSMLLALCLTLTLVPQAFAVSDSGSNDSLQTAQPVSLGDSISGEISPKGDVDFYSFQLTQSGKVTLDMKAYMEYYSLLLYDSSGERIWYDDYNQWTESVGFRNDTYHLFLEKGTYYLQVKGSVWKDGDSNYSGKYAVNTAFTSANATESEPNNSVDQANPVLLGDTIRGVVAQNDDYDFFQFSLTESGRVSLDITAYMEYYSLLLYDADGKRIWYDDYNQWTESVGFRNDTYHLFLEKGTYYLQVKGSVWKDGDSSYPGTYEIETAFDPANATEAEPNNSMDQANPVTLGEPIRGVIAQNGDYDWFQFAQTASNVLSIDVTAYLEYYSLLIYDTSGSLIWYDDYNQWTESSGYRTDAYQVDLEPGTYYLQVKGSVWKNGDSSYPGTYTLTLHAGEAVVPVTGVTLNKTSLTLAEGAQAALTASVQPSNATNAAVTWRSSNTKVATVSSKGAVTAVAPGSATITVTTEDGNYTAKCTVTVQDTTVPSQNPFWDVSASAYYYDAVLWAVEEEITSGTSDTTFSPNASCTRAQAVTFLWRAAGSPAPDSRKNPFRDVSSNAYYYDAVLWAVENGITSGTSANTFSPNGTVTRAQTVTFLYRAAGSPAASGSSFTDVPSNAYYAAAVRWAVSHNITSGTSSSTFSPNGFCTRGQIVTFLYRDMA